MVVPASRSNKVKIALVHEWFTTYAGSEKVLETILGEFPDADVYSLIDYLPPEHRAGLLGKAVRTTYMQRIPFISSLYKYALSLMPFAIEQLDLSGYDIIISNCHAVAKGVITGPDQLHICYCYSPMRYAWDLQTQIPVRVGDPTWSSQPDRALATASDPKLGLSRGAKCRPFHRLLRVYRAANQEGLQPQFNGHIPKCRGG